MRFEDVLRRYNISFVGEGHEHCRPGWIQVDCPFCSPGWNHYRLGFNLAQRYFNCWACGSKNVVDVLVKYRVPLNDAIEISKAIGREKIEEPQSKRGILKLPQGVGPLQPAHKKYLKKRGFDPDYLVQTWGVQGIGLASRLAWRIFIPITYQGEVVSWTTRTISGNKTPRYWSASEDEEIENHRHLLFGEDLVKDSIVIHEGPFDVFRTGPGAVGTLGLSYTRAQLLKMTKYERRTICFDNAPEAHKRALRLRDELLAFPGETNVVYLDSKDPGCATEEETKFLREFLT